MKNIVIKKLNLINFKGLRNQEINFDKDTSIYGDNGTGKTTIFDAFTWLLFGKDSQDRATFEIKTLDKNNVVIPKIEHEVSAIILVDNETISIRRILKENWVKKRGSLDSEFSGNITDYYWNEVPMQQKEFQSKVSAILDESVFKLITNPLAFNTIKWQDRRHVLTQIAGEISQYDLAKGNSEYENLISQLSAGKTLADYRKQIVESIKKAKEDLKAIPTRIDEVNRTMPEASDFEALKQSLTSKQIALGVLDNEIADVNKAFQSKLDEQKNKMVLANTLKAEIQSIEEQSKRDAKNSLKPDTTVIDKLVLKQNDVAANIETSKNTITNLNSNKSTLEDHISILDSKMSEMRAQWADANAKELTFNDTDFHCPTCKRAFEAGDVDSKKSEMILNFNNKKETILLEITEKGKAYSDEKTNIQNEVNELLKRIEKGNEYIATLEEELNAITLEIASEKEKQTPIETLNEQSVFESILASNTTYNAKKLELLDLEKTIETMPTVNNEALNEKRKLVIEEIYVIKNQLQKETQIHSVNKRIEELQNEEKVLAQQIANVEKEQFVIENFNKLMIDTLESKINSKFKFVKFRMFETQINGGESECCDALIDGVPFTDANTASKINAGLDIINALCEFYQVTAPIFIDNRESIVNLIPCESQIVNLIVSSEDKKLRVA